MKTPDNPLRAYRKAQNITLAGMAERLGVSRITVFRWETGAFLLPVARLNEVSSLTGIPREDLRPDIFADRRSA